MNNAKIWMKNFTATESAKLRAMTFKEKLQYIWEYYKFHISIFVIVVAIILTFIFSSSRDTYLYSAWFGPHMSQERTYQLGQRLSVIIDTQEHAPIMVTSYLMTGDIESDMALQQRFFAMIQAGMIDMIFATNEQLVDLASIGIFAPIQNLMEEVQDPAFYQQLSDRLHTITFLDLDYVSQTETKGISLDGSPLLAELGIPSHDLYLAVFFNAEYLDRIISVLGVLLS